MKNLYKLAGIAVLVAVIGFAAVSCDNGTTSDAAPSTSGRLIISNIPGLYNDKYIGLKNGDGLVGCANIIDGKPVWSKIKNGEATLKIWKKVGDDFSDYTGAGPISSSDEIEIYLSSGDATGVKKVTITTPIALAAGKAYVDYETSGLGGL